MKVEILSFITVARFGRKSCFMLPEEKSRTMVRYRITAFRLTHALNASTDVLYYILDYFSSAAASLTAVCYILANFSAISFIQSRLRVR